ncbi:ISL3 family transposase [Streptomyces sp. NPDC002738]
MRLLQLLHAPPVLRQAPRVLGVDEFAFRQGCTYGTILVDVEKRRPIDVLPDRTSETLASGLVAHPGVQIVCRDRASAYTRAIKEAAPHALEVADRWHLLRNLSQAGWRRFVSSTEPVYASTENRCPLLPLACPCWRHCLPHSSCNASTNLR